jgi:hypothetical protein
MPLQDLTVDTNVLMHASNPEEQRFDDSIALLKKILGLATSIAIDEQFHTDLSKNRSLIGQEYMSKLVTGTLGYNFVVQLAQLGRVVVVPTTLNAQTSRKLNRLVSNRRDRTFIKVSMNSTDRTFVSHDFLDFPARVRKAVRKEFEVEMLDAEATCNRA